MMLNIQMIRLKVSVHLSVMARNCISTNGILVHVYLYMELQDSQVYASNFIYFHSKLFFGGQYF